MKILSIKNKKSAKTFTIQLTALSLILLLALSGAGCLSYDAENRVSVSGSTTVLPLMQALTES
ncbi:MAG: hypothetical protein LBE57_02800, partial [Methanosarcinales archaeon]|nr:hypothetical protein [Methanosarcinales archaeon]